MDVIYESEVEAVLGSRSNLAGNLRISVEKGLSAPLAVNSLPALLKGMFHR